MKKIFILILVLVGLLMIGIVSGLTLLQCKDPIVFSTLTDAERALCAIWFCEEYYFSITKDVTYAKAICVPKCGDNIRAGGELCDGTDLGKPIYPSDPSTPLVENTCNDMVKIGKYVHEPTTDGKVASTGTVLGCYPEGKKDADGNLIECTWDISNCVWNDCGDGIINSWIDKSGGVWNEKCDPPTTQLRKCNPEGVIIFPVNQWVKCTDEDCMVDDSACMPMCCFYSGSFEDEKGQLVNLYVKAINLDTKGECKQSLLTNSFAPSCPTPAANTWYDGSDGYKYLVISMQSADAQSCTAKAESDCITLKKSDPQPPPPGTSLSSQFTSIAGSGGIIIAGTGTVSFGQWITVEVIA